MSEKTQTDIKQILDLFITTTVTDILQPSYRKMILNKLRWVLTDSGISPYRLPSMPLLHYIQISEVLEYPLSQNPISEYAYYRILAARNILVLLLNAYSFNDAVMALFDTPIGSLFQYADSLPAGISASIKKQIPYFMLSEQDSLAELTDAISIRIEPITELHHRKRLIRYLLTDGSYKGVLTAYRLFRSVFSLLFVGIYPEKFGAAAMKPIYRNVRFYNDFEDKFTGILSGKEEDAHED